MTATELELLGELDDESEQELMELEPFFYRRGASAQRFGKNEWRALENAPPLPGLPIPGTIHRLTCGANGCPPFLAAQCAAGYQRGEQG
jgi:hypothetical protein